MHPIYGGGLNISKISLIIEADSQYPRYLYTRLTAEQEKHCVQEMPRPAPQHCIMCSRQMILPPGASLAESVLPVFLLLDGFEQSELQARVQPHEKLP